MRVLQYIEPRRIQIAEVPCPTLGDGEVLIQTRACGICATDVKTFMRGHPLIRSGAVLGHEMSGIIAQTRAQGWRAGERVIVAPYVSCGECNFCNRGRFTLCANLFDASVQPGGFSEFLRVPSRVVKKGLFRLPDAVDFPTASLAEPLACCFHGLEAMDLSPDDSLLILGDGPMGLLQTLAARAIGASPIVLAGMTAERLAFAATCADHVINVATENLRDTAMKLSNNAGFNKVIVSVGEADVAEQALALAARGGTLNFFAGLPSGARVTIDPNRIHYDGITLLGTFGFAPSHFTRAVNALTGGGLDPTGLITRTIGLNQLQDAFVDSAAYRGIKTVVVFE